MKNILGSLLSSTTLLLTKSVLARVSTATAFSLWNARSGWTSLANTSSRGLHSDGSHDESTRAASPTSSSPAGPQSEDISPRSVRWQPLILFDFKDDKEASQRHLFPPLPGEERFCSPSLWTSSAISKSVSLGTIFVCPRSSIAHAVRPKEHQTKQCEFMTQIPELTLRRCWQPETQSLEGGKRRVTQ